MSTPLTEEQIHSISWLSNAAFDLKYPTFQELQSTTAEIVNQTLTNTSVQGMIGTWVQVWGPVVFSNNQNTTNVVADNTMMLLYNQASNSFVVGVAGTNAVSTYGWLQEDFNVNSLVTWPSIIGTKPAPWYKGNPSISAGTNAGLQHLLAMTGPQLTVTGNPTATMLVALSNYIAANNISGATVAVTGHSLGGALSPTLAMYMHDMAATWNASQNVTTISTYPTAGPTPGNQLFATYLSNNLGANYVSRYNTIDIVPQAWQVSTMVTIPQIYGTNIPYPETVAPYSTTIGMMVAGAYLKTINKADFLPISYAQATPWNAMTGTFDTATDTNAKNTINLALATEPSGLSQYSPYILFLYRFLNQALFQHTTAYNTLLNIVAFSDEYALIKKGIVGTTVEERQQECLHTVLSTYYNMPDFTALLAAKEAAAASPETAETTEPMA